jgi:hypothetical protein
MGNRLGDGLLQVTEADRVSGLVAMGRMGRFAYSLTNGTVGVYNKTSRVWRWVPSGLHLHIAKRLPS